MVEIILGKPNYWWEIDHSWLPQLGCPEPLANKGDEKAASVMWLHHCMVKLSSLQVLELENLTAVEYILISLSFSIRYQKMSSLDNIEFAVISLLFSVRNVS